MNFRIAKCLVNGKINEYAIFEDGNKQIIEEDEKYGKYFRIINPYSNDRLSKYFYPNLIKDAIESIRNGFGDVLTNVPLTSFIGGGIDVIYFLNREIGEELRKKSIEGWKDVKFTYCIAMGYKNSFYEYSRIDTKLRMIYDNSISYKTFETKEEAENFAKQLIEIAKGYVSYVISPDSFDLIMNEVEDKYGKLSVIEELIGDIVSDDLAGFKKEDHSLDKMGYRVEQCILYDEETISEMEKNKFGGKL